MSHCICNAYSLAEISVFTMALSKLVFNPYFTTFLMCLSLFSFSTITNCYVGFATTLLSTLRLPCVSDPISQIDPNVRCLILRFFLALLLFHKLSPLPSCFQFVSSSLKSRTSFHRINFLRFRRKRSIFSERFGRSLVLHLFLSFHVCSSIAENQLVPRVHRLDPPGGPKSGGTAVFIYGENFAPTKSFCKFGKVVQSIFPSLVTSSIIVCFSPPSLDPNPSRVQLQVTSDGGYTYSIDRVTFFYSGCCKML